MDPRVEIEQWINEYVERLVRLAYTYLRDWGVSEDAVQEAFLRAYECRIQLRNAEDPFPWLARIVVNQCKTAIRKTWREVITEVLPIRKSLGAEDTAVTREQTNVVHESIMALPESLRTPLYLYYFEEMPTKEIAHVMSVTDGAIRIRLTRARERLAAELFRREANGYPGEITASKIPISAPRC